MPVASRVLPLLDHKGRCCQSAAPSWDNTTINVLKRRSILYWHSKRHPPHFPLPLGHDQSSCAGSILKVHQLCVLKCAHTLLLWEFSCNNKIISKVTVHHIEINLIQHDARVFQIMPHVKHTLFFITLFVSGLPCMYSLMHRSDLIPNVS